jgi:uncharacterized protein
MGEGQRPVAPGERILELDVIRGFAMFGVLVAYCLWSLGTLPAERFTSLDKGLDQLAGFAVDGKAYSLLAFLFGLGFQLQIGRLGTDDRQSVRLYLRRMLVLAAIGLVHALLLRNSDILLPYAAAGLVLIVFRHASDRAVLLAALLFLLFPVAAFSAWTASGWPMPTRPSGGGSNYIAENFAWLRYWYSTAILNWPTNLSLFLIGLVAGRRGWIGRIAAQRRIALLVLGVGLAAGIALFAAGGWVRSWLVAVRLPELGSLPGLLFVLHAAALAAAYAALLTMALRTGAGRRVLRPLAAVGRMALTNYLMQAALIVPFCLAFGLFDRFTPSSALLLALLMFPMQCAFSLWWLARFDFGPAEWLWRLLTYGRLSRRTASGVEAGL